MRSLPLLLVLLLPVLVRAGDEPPLRPFEETTASLPAPREAAAFDVRGRVDVEGRTVGTFRLAASVDTEAESTGWSLVEERRTTFEGVELELVARAATDAALQPVAGELVEVDGFGDRLIHTWKADAEGYRVETRSAARQPMGRSAEREGPCLTTVAALLLFARLVPDTPASWEARWFRPDWDYLQAERPFVATRLVYAPGAGDDAETKRVLSAVEERGRVDVVLEAATRDPVRVTIRQKGHATLVLVPGPTGASAEGPAPEGDDLFRTPSPTPRGCAARVVLAFETVDAEAFEALIHWPTLRRAMKGKIRGEVSDEAFRASILDQFRRQGAGREPRAASEARDLVRQEAPGFEVASEGKDAAVVTLSAAWGGMRLTLCRVDGAWFLGRLPGS